jgi:hypothetical protein
MIQTVELALKEKAPKLYAQLAANGTLKAHVRDLAEQINAETVRLVQEDRRKNHWDKLGPMELAGKLKMSDALNQERVMADLLEFPQDETSPQNQG